MADINVCSVIGQNTGGLGCDPKKDVPKKVLAGAATFTSTSWTADGAMYTALQGKINQAQGATDKLYPFPLIEGSINNTEAPTFGNLGYGTRLKLKNGLPAYSFQVRCGESQFKRLQAFDGIETYVLIIDAKDRLWGTINTAGTFRGFTASISVTGNGFEDGSTVEAKTATIEISLISEAEFNRQQAWIDSIIESDYKGLNSFQTAKVGAVSGTTKFELKIPQSMLGGLRQTVNLASFYSSELAATNKWVCKSGTAASYAAGTAPATALPLTSVTYNAADKTWSLVFDNTAYSAINSGDYIRVNITDPATLFAAGITGVEGLYVDIVKP